MRPGSGLYFVCLTVFLIIPIAQAQQPSPCALTPLSPAKPGSNLFTAEQEGEIGDFLSDQSIRWIRPIEDSELSAELQRIGERLVKHLPPNELKFQFFLSDASQANAFSFVGGRVYVTRKLIGQVHSEDELAGVMGHELGHIVTHQQAKLYTRVFREKLGIAEVADRKDLYQKLNRMYDEWNQHGSITFDPEADQQEADRTGMEAVVRAGYSPQALAEFWDRFTENKGKTGNWLSEMLMTTQPNVKRYREMTKELAALPASCRDVQPAGNSEQFKKWQTAVVTFRGMRTSDDLHKVVWQKRLDPPLQDAIHTLKFSRDGKYVLAQDSGNIYVLSHDPFKTVFQISAPDAYPAQFTPDSGEIVFYDRSLRVERWNLKSQEQVSATEVYVMRMCLQTLLSPDGKTLACYRGSKDLDLIEVATGDHFLEKKNFLEGKADMDVGLSSLTFKYSLKYLNLGFSPDGRYFVAALKSENSLIYDIAGKHEIPVPGPLKPFLGMAFAFVTPESILGFAGQRGEKSAIVEFPSGKVLRPLDLGGARPTAATHGDYVLIRPIKDYAVGILDVNANQLVGANKQSALDVYDKQYVAEMKNGQVGLFGTGAGPMAEATLPRGVLGKLRTTALSGDLNWLAVSERSRGAVWALPTSSRVLNLREFQGAYFAPDGVLFADFPKHDVADRSVARISLQQKQFSVAVKALEPNWKQHGAYLVGMRSAKKENNSEQHPDDGEDSVAALGEGLNLRIEDLAGGEETAHNTVFEVRKVESGELIWSLPFPKEAPRSFVSESHKTVCFVWYAGQDAAKIELKAHPEWRQNGQPNESDQLLEIYDLASGVLRTGLVVTTGAGSFSVTSAGADGDSLLVEDNRGRVIVYSLSTGKEIGKQIGELITFSNAAGAFCLQKVPGRLEIYSLGSMEKTDEFGFSNNVVMATFTDEKRLFVLTDDQTGYLLESDTRAKVSASSKEARK
jgi:hypothetical protein